MLNDNVLLRRMVEGARFVSIRWLPFCFLLAAPAVFRAFTVSQVMPSLFKSLFQQPLHCSWIMICFLVVWVCSFLLGRGAAQQQQVCFKPIPRVVEPVGSP